MRISFGTDGIRGIAGRDLTPEVAVALGRAAARHLGPGRVVVGSDTRRSSPMLRAAAAAGACGEGAEVVDVGVVPTPAVARLSTDLGCTGVAVTASHNPWDHNGIKLFAPGGRKLTDEQEAAVEATLANLLGSATSVDERGTPPGTISQQPELPGRWRDALLSHVGQDLSRLRIAVDCANGAASVLGPEVLRAAGLAPVVLHASPDGANINAGCGSTHPGDLVAAVRGGGLDCGFAFDGDADRVVAVDADGGLVDGDQLVALLAVDRKQRGCLAGDAVAVSVWSNLGLHVGLARHGIGVSVTDVGDRHILARLEAAGLEVGGEQSGHIILADRAWTGDGVQTALAVLDVLARTGAPLRELADAAMVRMPQRTENVAVSSSPTLVVEALDDELLACNTELGERGRVVLRASGTERVVRVMAEASAAGAADDLVERFVELVQAADTV